MNKLLMAAIDHYQAQKTDALAHLDILFNDSVGIGEHTDIVGALDIEVEKMAHAEEKLLAVKNHFVPNQEL